MAQALAEGELITYRDGRLVVPDRPVVPFVEGDGTGPEIWRAARAVLDAAVAKAYHGQRAIVWREVLAGEKAHRETGDWLPEESVETIKRCRVAIKGPLATPVGGGIRSLNVVLRQVLDLYACVRPVRWFQGVPSPVREPHKVDMVIFRENTEDVYAGIEWKAGSAEARKVIAFLSRELGVTVRPDSGLGIKPISATGTKRLVRRAIQYALDHHLPSVTLVHKGNIMKYTEGAFREWGYEVAREEFGDVTIAEAEAAERHLGIPPEGRLLIKDRIADNMFQQVLLRPEEYHVIATPNLNGDYLSDALAAMVGGLGMAPGGNIGDGYAVFEATHGTAPKYAGKDMVNPTSLILSGAMMLEHLGWERAARLVVSAVERTILQKTVTYDLARSLEGARLVRTSEFAELVVQNL